MVSFKNKSGMDKAKKEKNVIKKITEEYETQNALAMELTEQEALELQMNADVLFV